MYGKLFVSMYEGSLVAAGWEALVTLQQLVILADKHGVVDKTPEWIARTTTVPLGIITKGLAALERPDPESRTPGEEGRRIVRLSETRSWGWRIVNYTHYRNLRSADDRREYHRQYYRDHRSPGRRVDSTTPQPDPAQTQHHSTDSTKAEAEAKAKARSIKTKPSAAGAAAAGPKSESLDILPKADCDQLFEKWSTLFGAVTYGRFRKTALTAFQAGVPRYSIPELLDAITAAYEWWREQDDRDQSFFTFERFVEQLAKWVKFGKMPVMQNGVLTERGNWAGSKALRAERQHFWRAS